VIAVDVTRHSVEDRVAGLAAEMAFWALLSFFPLVVAITALLGYAENIVGVEQLEGARDAIVAALAVVFSGELTREVVRPFIGGLLSTERGGVALAGLLVALYLASRVFTATIRSLDLAYRVPERRGLVAQRLIALAFAVGFVVVVVASLMLMVVGPLFGGGRSLAASLGMGNTFAVLWSVFRWPALLVIMVGFLTTVYRFGPNVENAFRHCLPGALLAVAMWTLASLGLRLYLAAGGSGVTMVDFDDEAVALVGRAVGTVLAMMLWVFVTGLSILVGGELNAEVSPHASLRRRGIVRQPAP
jgi:membrane protein